jgi:hypothetical protein
VTGQVNTLLALFILFVSGRPQQHASLSCVCPAESVIT